MMLESDSLLAFCFAATLLTITPGLDTALVLRTAVSEGPRRAMMAGLGIALGCLAWGFIVAVGLGALLEASELAYNVLRLVGAAYLLYLGIGLLRSPRRTVSDRTLHGSVSGVGDLTRGFLTNILNPKIGVFYASFLPQFISPGADVAWTTVSLTVIHAFLGLIWFVTLTLATQQIAAFFRKDSVVIWFDRVTGVVFVAFAFRLAINENR